MFSSPLNRVETPQLLLGIKNNDIVAGEKNLAG